MIRAILKNGECRALTPKVQTEGETRIVRLPRTLDYSEIETIEFEYMESDIREGDAGYFVLPGSLTYFRGHEGQCRDEIYGMKMPLFGVKTEEQTYVAIMTGMRYGGGYFEKTASGGVYIEPGEVILHMEAKDGRYRLYPIYQIHGVAPYEDIEVRYTLLHGEDADYSGMARVYRAYQEAHGCTRLTERAAVHPELAYAISAPLIRIRIAWKPVPSPVLHQTRENEPPVFVGCSFRRVMDLIDEMKRQGIERAELCLVGWNVKGHDGRWPETFPACEEAGGDADLAALIDYAKASGYTIAPHTNCVDAYEIAENYDPEKMIRRPNGEIERNDESWSGGEMHHVCPQCSYEDREAYYLPIRKKYGWNGIHYSDVMSCVPPRSCSHPAHRINRRQGAEYWRNTMRYAQELFGAFSSEAGYDFAADSLDYVLYIGGERTAAVGDMADELIPLWELVYHGMILHNPFCSTINAIRRDRGEQLCCFEYGGRPTFYINYKFSYNKYESERQADLRVGTDEELRETVADIRRWLEECRPLQNIMAQPMEHHEIVAPGIRRTRYADGTTITVNYNDGTVSFS